MRKTSYHGYNISELEQVFIAIHVLKTRFGTSDFWVPVGFYGDCTSYYELPKPDEIYDYEKYKTPYWTLENKEENEEDQLMNEDISNTFKQNSKFIL